ncbi:signaling modulator of AmpD, AmpE [Simiduia agarivorans]|uniref:Signaling modulator of AmpD, AmpE n=1 Tax=Simiduia agarivorans (strain DSM 21679 / JCM 13881 / BCRC 17597 / SA1) TaxID=1117647 RepID=K4L3G2_SIMAS|nr:signaling modulator of AmpD, AmpE [Simiduia agarivorans]AFV00718.1 signaling modulator of AmpD, AmpE [Simiduia agarivorans SA1 = DSM 21679]
MGFLSLLVVLLLVQLWGFGGPLQQDSWYRAWCQWLVTKLKHPAAVLALGVFLPVILLLVAMMALYVQGFGWLLVLLNIPVLLFALGRGRLDNLVQDYKDAWEAQARDDACKAVNALRLDGEQACQTDSQWQGVHAEAFQAISYRGFERMFAVLFWFSLLGAPGALLYRLTALSAREPLLGENSQDPIRHLLWLLEWPAARVYYLSVAMVGDFVACAERWRVLGLCMKSPTAMVVEAFNRGALGLDGALVREIDAGDTAAVAEIDKLVQLMSRALILWVCAAALIALLLGG